MNEKEHVSTLITFIKMVGNVKLMRIFGTLNEISIDKIFVVVCISRWLYSKWQQCLCMLCHRSSQSHIYTLMELRTKQKEKTKTSKNRINLTRATDCSFQAHTRAHTFIHWYNIHSTNINQITYNFSKTKTHGYIFRNGTRRFCIHIYKTSLTEFINFNGQFCNSFKHFNTFVIDASVSINVSVFYIYLYVFIIVQM